MVGTEVLIVGIVVPLIVGPVSIFFKSLWDKYSDSKEEKRKNHYETRLNELKNKIDLFYWPVYIKLKCLYSLNYSDNKFSKKSSNNESLLSDNESDKDDKINNFIKSKMAPKIKKIRKRKLINQNNNELNYNTDISLDWDDDISIYNRNTDIELVDDSEISSDEKDNKDNEKNIQKDTNKISVKVDDIFIQELDKKIISLSLEIKSIIENNISIIKPNKDLISEIVRFVRLTEMIIIVNESNDKINNQDLENIKNIKFNESISHNKNFNKNIKTKKHYHYDNMGVVNNTRNFYKLIKEELDDYMLEYQELFNEYNNLQNFKNCSKIFNCQNKT